MVRVLINGLNTACPDPDNADFINYWCTVLSGFRGFDLVFEGPITDIAWAVLRPSLSIDVITWVIEDSGLEEYFVTTIITPGCNTQGAVILVPREPLRLMEFYRQEVVGLGSIRCAVLSRESFSAWLRIVDGLVRNVGVEELIKYAIDALSRGSKDVSNQSRLKNLGVNRRRGKALART
ncbi:MAG: hypothetical protein ACP5GZ_01485 [Vulcanisaeta sp.]|uniref:hypothetical protein n=1 Tax=Vulcanisaeta sp. TaxID=2020871 RepID=UPI003D0A317C